MCYFRWHSIASLGETIYHHPAQGRKDFGVENSLETTKMDDSVESGHRSQDESGNALRKEQRELVKLMTEGIVNWR